MNEADALELLRAAIWTIIIGSGPAVGAAMFVGLIIALLQALTQIQESTLTFVPKIVAVFIALAIGHPLSEVKFIRLPNWFIRGSKKASRPEPLQDASLMVSILLFCRMIFSKKSATFWDNALGDPTVA